MFSRRRGLATASAVAAVALAAAGCGSGSTSGGTGTSADKGAGTPQRGGTLTMLGVGDVDHIDSADWYYSTDYILARMISRQLLTYPTKNGQAGKQLVADAATEVPSQGNGGLSGDRKTITFHLRDGIKWNTTPARAVTSQDFARGFARLCNPVIPYGASQYLTDGIDGFKTFCDGELKVDGTPTAIADYIKTNLPKVAGIKTPDDKTLIVGLTQPSGDILNIFALAGLSAAPEEYLQYKPDSPEFAAHILSDGPYKIDNYDPAKSMSLSRNPAWSAATDPVRKAYVDKVNVTENLTQEGVQQQLQAGTGDMEWDTFPPPTQVPALKQANDPGLNLGETSSSNPYMVMNVVDPNANGALKNLKVRQAISYAVDKKNVLQSLGGPLLNNELNQVLPPSIRGGEQRINLYPGPDIAKAKQLLTEAGFPTGLSLNLLYRNKSQGSSQAAQVLQNDLGKAGIKITLLPTSNQDFYAKYLQAPPSASTQRGLWDLAVAGWGADWTGNAARTFFSPLFDGRHFAPESSNFGDYNNPAVNQLIDKAIAEPDIAKAADIWHQADMTVMKDAPFVPLTNPVQSDYFNPKRVHNWTYVELFQQGDPTNIWLSK